MNETIYSYHVPGPPDGLWYDYKLDPSPAKDKFSTHTHDMFEINYFISGRARFSVEGNIYHLQPDDVLIMRPAETHMPIMDEPEPYERMTIHMSLAYLKKFCPECERLLAPFVDRKLGTLNQYHNHQFVSQHWKSCLQAMAAQAKSSFDERTYINVNLLAFLAELNLAFMFRDLEQDKLESNELSVRIIRYINQCLFDEISVQSVSDHFHISATHLNRLFHQSTGTSIWKYITAKRLIAARERIQAGCPAHVACQECGFGDYSSFFRAYKARFHIAPKQDSANYHESRAADRQAAADAL